MSALHATGTLPRFDLITSAEVEPAIRDLLARYLRDLEALEQTVQPTWDGSVARITALGEPLAWAWSVVNHLLGVRNSPDLRRGHESVQADVVQAWMRLGQSVPLYRALKQVAGDAALDPVRRRIAGLMATDAELSGVALEGAARERFQAVETELAALATRFENQLLDATKAFHLDLTEPNQIAGLPPTLVRALAARAAAAWAEAGKHGPEPTAERGPWRVTLDFPIAGPFLEHARDRALRETVYRAMVTRASTGAHDNGPVLERILLLRQEKAELLGKRSFAEISLATKMAGTVAAVEQLSAELHAPAQAKARAELADLTTFARAELNDPAWAPKPWDIAFWAERQRERQFAFTDEELRPYFALDAVLDGMFACVARIFGVKVRRADGEAPVWHPDVRFFRIADAASGSDLAAFYLDPYSRPAEKRGGAWMDDCLGRKRLADGSMRLPVAYLICNQTPPAGGAPSLMSFREVETLFHEFGHGLQHMLTTVDHPEAAGIRSVEWDAVELASQFMEHWCLDRKTVLGRAGITGLARHWQTGVPLPDELFAKLKAARTWRAGSATLRQLFFARVDIELHHRYRGGGAVTALDVKDAVARDHTVLPPLPEDRSLCSFSHIFAGGYAAGYYSYKWAEVLSSDAFAAFEEAGLDDEATLAATGRRYRATILAQGGSRHPLDIFRDFRGRAPSTAALLRHTGLA